MMSDLYFLLFFSPQLKTENIKQCLVSQQLRSVHLIQMNLNTLSFFRPTLCNPSSGETSDDLKVWPDDRSHWFKEPIRALAWA